MVKEGFIQVLPVEQRRERRNGEDVVLSRFSPVQRFATLWSVAHQTPLSKGFSRQEYWSGLPCPPPGNLLEPGIEPMSPALQAESLPMEPPGSDIYIYMHRVFVAQLCPTLCDPMECILTGSSVHGDSLGKKIGVGCHFLLQGIFPTQGSNPGPLHHRWILYQLSYQGSPYICILTLKRLGGTKPMYNYRYL